jgi:hypothetical protein
MGCCALALRQPAPSACQLDQWSTTPLCREQSPRLTVTLHGCPLHAVGTEDVHIHELGGAHKLKHDVAHLVQRVHRQATLFLQLPAAETGIRDSAVPVPAQLSTF